MKYREYMGQFSLADEMRPALIAKMERRARALRAEEKEGGERKAPAIAPKKKDPFRLHPIRWAAIFTSIALVLVSTPLLAMFALRGEKQGTLTEIKLDYMKDLMVDTEGVTAYSIRRETEDPAAASLSAGGEKKGPAISFFPGLAVEQTGPTRIDKHSKKDRSYLYSTTETYETGNVEYDEAGIKRVTFMKNREVSEDVYDENGDLIDENRRIGQEEIDAQINRIYTTDRFTFLQFAPLLEDNYHVTYMGEDGELIDEYMDIRQEGLVYDENGITSFDAGEPFYQDLIYEDLSDITVNERALYFSNPVSASFVVDNVTGYLYKIEKIGIWAFINGLAIGMQTDPQGYHGERYWSIYSLTIDADDNLVFTDVFPNKDVKFRSAFTGNDGWTYVINEKFDETDAEKKIRYMLYDDSRDSSTFRRYAKDGEGNYFYIHDDHSVEQFVGGTLIPFENHGLLRLHTPQGLRSSSPWLARFYDLPFGMYEDLRLGGEFLFSSIGEPKRGFAVEGGADWLDDNFDVLIRQTNGRLFYKLVDLADHVDDYVVFTENDFTKLSDLDLEAVSTYYMNVGNDRYKIKDVYCHKGINETKYYHVVRTEEGPRLEELTTKTYSSNVFIFQPINK